MAKKKEIDENLDRASENELEAAQSEDILTVIEAEHRQVEQLFAEIESAKGKKKQDCFNTLYKELTLHAQAEERVFYPAMREYKETAQYIEEAESEHNSAKILLEQMKNLKPGDEEFETKFFHLKESVSHHVEEEEHEIFEAVRKCMEESLLQELGQSFKETKSRLMPDVEMALTNK